MLRVLGKPRLGIWSDAFLVTEVVEVRVEQNFKITTELFGVLVLGFFAKTIVYYQNYTSRNPNLEIVALSTFLSWIPLIWLTFIEHTLSMPWVMDVPAGRENTFYQAWEASSPMVSGNTRHSGNISKPEFSVFVWNYLTRISFTLQLKLKKCSRASVVT